MVVKVVGIDGNRVTLETEFTDLFDKEELEITIGEAKKKRSKDANAYFHVLVGKIADKLRMSKMECKNIMLSRYGQYEYQDGKRMVISVDSDIDMMNREDIHCSALGYGEINGKQFTHYAIMKPSHEMTSYEMAKLIDGVVDEAKALGIETLSPAEIERIKERWNL